MRGLDVGLYDATAIGAEKMPAWERRLLEVFDDPAGGIGLGLDAEGVVVFGYWLRPVVSRSESIGDVSMSLTSSCPWVGPDSTSPFDWIFGTPGRLGTVRDRERHDWEDERPGVYAITRAGLVDLRTDSAGVRRSAAEVAEVMLGAGPHVPLFIEEPQGFPVVASQSADGRWTTSSCGPDLEWYGDYPTGDSRMQDLIVESGGYDSPLSEDGYHLPGRASWGEWSQAESFVRVSDLRGWLAPRAAASEKDGGSGDMEKLAVQYEEIADAYDQTALGFAESHLGRSLNEAEATKYRDMAQRVRGWSQ